jgi:putative tricarboxylic transport membrane protein
MFFARYSEVILGAIVVTTMTIMITVIVPISVAVPKSNKVMALSPDFWIKIIIWSTLALGIGILVRGVKRARSEIDADELAEIEERAKHRHPPRRALMLLVIAVAGLFAYYAAIDWLGMVLASIVALAGFVLLCGERRFLVLAPLAVLLPVSLYYFFLKVAGIPMPLGIFE